MLMQEIQMIAQVIDVLLCFVVSFICFFVPYKLMAKSEEVQDYDAILKSRIARLSKQQDELLESANERISTFVKVQHEEFGQGEGASDSFIERVHRIMKNAGITDMTTNAFLIACSIGGICFAAFILYFEFLNFITGIPIGFAIGAYLVYNFLASRAEKRKMEFLKLQGTGTPCRPAGVKRLEGMY